MIKTYICDDCGYEAEMDESEYDGMCPACHEHHGFYEVEPSDTYTTGHNENETVVVCDRNKCLQMEYNGKGCAECGEVTE